MGLDVKLFRLSWAAAVSAFLQYSLVIGMSETAVLSSAFHWLLGCENGQEAKDGTFHTSNSAPGTEKKMHVQGAAVHEGPLVMPEEKKIHTPTKYAAESCPKYASRVPMNTTVSLCVSHTIIIKSRVEQQQMRASHLGLLRVLLLAGIVSMCIRLLGGPRGPSI